MMLTEEPEEMGDAKGVVGRDFAKSDIEASANQSTTVRRTPISGMQMKRTVSFEPGHYKPSRDKRKGRSRSSTMDSIDTDLSESDYEETLDGDDDDLDDDDFDDDGTSTILTDASDVSEDEPDDDHRHSKRHRLTPKFVSKRREKRRRRREKAKRENMKGNSTKVYRRTPVLSGVIAPFSIMLEIPGFTSRWYVSTNPVTGVVTYKPNPIILDVGLALSLTGAIIANIAILGRFAERIPPRKATLIATFFLLFHDIINAVALITFGVIHAVDDGYTYSEAYWMTTAATAASLICTTSLIIDYLSTKNFKYAGSGLTPKQAQLVMVIMAFLAYLSISAMIYALILPLPFLDSMYFMVETLATVGLGDITPATVGARVALFFIAPGGIVLLAVVVIIARQTIIEEFENAYKRRKAVFRRKAAERKEERKKNRHLVIKVKRGGRGGSAAVLPNTLALTPNLTMSSMNSSSMSYITPAEPVPPAATHDGNRWWGGSWTSGFARKGANVPRPGMINPASDPEAGLDEKDGSSDLKGGSTLHRSDTMATSASQLKEYEAMLSHHRKDIEDSFKKFRVDLAKAERNEFWTKLGIAASLFACFWLLGGAIFQLLEGWTYFEGFYFVFVVFTSIGYGDLSPKTSAGRAFFIVWALFGVGTLTILFSVVSDAWANQVQQKKLAGETVKKGTLWSKMAKKVRGNKGRDDVPREDQTEDEHAGGESIGGSHPASVAEEEGEKTAQENGETIDGETKGGGILLEPGTNEKTGQSSVASSVEGESAAMQEANINQLHLDITTTAMEFHHSALDLYQQNAQNIVETYSHVPEVREVVQRQSNNPDRRKVSEEDRAKMLDAVRDTGDTKAVQSMHQWLIMQDFEHYLHSLVDRSASFEREVARRETMLHEAQEELQKLRAFKLPHQQKDSDSIEDSQSTSTPPFEEDD